MQKFLPLLLLLPLFASRAAASVPTVAITASSSSISAGQSDKLTVTETNAGSIKVTGSNGTSYSLPYSGGSITVSPSSTTTYTATATNGSGSATAEVSGVVALLLGEVPNLSTAAARKILLETSRRAGAAANFRGGEGLDAGIDACAAVAALGGHGGCADGFERRVASH